MEDADLKDAEDYVSIDGSGNIEIDYAQMICDVAGGEPDDWNDAEGPDTGCGDDIYYVHDDGNAAHVNVDQGFVRIVVSDADGDDVAEGSIDLNDSATWSTAEPDGDEDPDNAEC